MKVLVANLPSVKKQSFIREGRCSQLKKIWNTVWPPYSLASIAAVLEEQGNAVRLYDHPAENAGPRKFAALLKDFNPQALILNCSTPTVDDDMAAARMIKQTLPGCKIIVFGIHGTVFSAEMLKKYQFLDFVIRGEPEYTAKELISSLSGAKKTNPESIPGITRRSEGKIVRNEDRPLISDLDELPMPAWHLIDRSKYRLPLIGKPYLMIVPGRGCVNECLFCCAHAYYGRVNRRHSAARIIEEIVFYKQHFKTDYFSFWTENFTQDRSFLINLLDEMAQKKLKIKWACNSRVDTVDEELLSRMKKSGCLMIAYGVESGDQDVLDMSGKNTKIDQIEKAFRLTRKAGLDSIAYCMFGLPGETPRSMKNTVKLLGKIDPTYAQFYTAVPRPGSEFYELAKKKSWLRTDDWSRFHQEDYVLDINGLNRADIVGFKKRAKMFFYLNPGRLARISMNIIKTIFSIK